MGMRHAEEISLSPEERSALYYALLLKDAGCSSNAARMAALFGSEDREVKPRMKLVDWHRRVGLALQTARTVGLGQSIPDRIRHFDKPGALTAPEWVQVQEHPKHTLSILSQVSAFGDFAWTAALHHEKLDGSGCRLGFEEQAARSGADSGGRGRL